MELILVCGVLLSLLVIVVSLLPYFLSTHKHHPNDPKLLPPGKTGWPVIGESIEFLFNLKECSLEKFFLKRKNKYSCDVFRTSILGNHVAVVCGVEGSKFLFSNSNKLLARDLPYIARKIFMTPEMEVAFDACTKPALLAFVKADGLNNFVGVMDTMAQQHLESWKEQVTVYPSVKRYLFDLACWLYLSIEDPEEVEKLFQPMETLMFGIQSMPINLPGTPMNRAMKSASAIKLYIESIVKHQRFISESSSRSADHKNDLLFHLIQAHKDDHLVAEGIMGLIVGGYEPVSSVLCMIFKVLADHPDAYQKVYQENLEVASMKRHGDVLSWEDTQKMRYTWNVVREVMRLYTPGSYISREATSDIMFAGYHIPKGYELILSMQSIHKDPKYFPDPEKFDPSRFDGDGPLPYTYMPFGGGSFMCPGMTYARLALLVFLHNVVKRFKWEGMIPNEKIVGIPLPKPAKGFPVHLLPHIN